MNTVLLLLALSGLYISLYFTLVYYGKIRPEGGFVPAFCTLDEKDCQRVIVHPHARIFLVPNFILGIVYYGLVLMVVFFGGGPVLSGGIMYASWLTVGVAFFLLYSLLYKVGMFCPLCLTAHGINILIACVLTYGRI